MDHKTYEKLATMLENGKVRELDEVLQPYLTQGDHDARFLAAHYSIDRNETVEEIDDRKINEIQSLANQLHPRAMYVLAWCYRLGDGVEEDRNKFSNYLMASALLGYDLAISDIATELEGNLGLSKFSEKFDVPD